MSTSPLSAGKHTATLNGLSINYTVLASTPNLPPIILHPPPWGIGSELYIKAFSRLSTKYTVIVPSPRGNDTSQRPSDPAEMSSRHIVADLEALRIHLGLETIPAILGHSAGGNIALGYAITYPRKVDKLILIDSDLMGYARKDTSWFSEALGPFLASPPTNDDEFKKFMIKTLPSYFAYPDLGGPDSVIEIWTDTSPSLWAYGTNFMADSANAPGEGGPGDGNAKWKQVDELGKIEAKVLVIVGEMDRCCAPEVSATIASGCKYSRLAVLGACAHFPWVEREGEFWGVLEDGLGNW